MKNLLYFLASITAILFIFSCSTKHKENEESKLLFNGADDEIELVVLDPGHFHTSLLQKFPQKQINDTVLVYAPKGDELNQYLESIERFNQRTENPAEWHEVIYVGDNYLEKMIREKKEM